jgi:hypothetical protein
MKLKSNRKGVCHSRDTGLRNNVSCDGMANKNPNSMRLSSFDWNIFQLSHRLVHHEPLKI